MILDALTGLRWGELSALKWEDIDEAEGVVRVQRRNWKGQEQATTKTGKVKVVPLLPEVAEVLRIGGGWSRSSIPDSRRAASFLPGKTSSTRDHRSASSSPGRVRRSRPDVE